MEMSYTLTPRPSCAVCEHLAGIRSGWPTVVETALSVALVPSRQPTMGTSLIVPRRHVIEPSGLSVKEDDDLWLLVCDMVGATLKGFPCQSYHVSQYIGALTG